MRRIRLKTLMIAILAVALLLGVGMALKRRSSRNYRLYVEQTLEARRLADQMSQAPDKAAIARLLRRAHWHNWVGAEYHKIASSPWQTFEPDPTSVACDCSHCGGRYRGGVINDDVPLDFASP
jgi:hypothetical protein